MSLHEPLPEKLVLSQVVIMLQSNALAGKNILGKS